MKKFIAILIFIFTIITGSYTYSTAAEYLIGLRGGYFMWEPWIKEAAGSLFEQMDTGSGALYGPVASVMFTDDLTLSFSGLFGNQQGSGLSKNIQTEPSVYQNVKFSFEVLRIDLDSALSYRISDNIKIFAGYKFWYLKTEYSAIDFRYDSASANDLTEVNQDELTFKQPFHGPAAGLGFSVPIGSRGFFFSGNVSGLYMWGKMKLESDTAIRYSGIIYGTNLPTETNTDMKVFGVNVEPTIGLNAGEGLPVFTLGVRYQVNKMKFVNQPDDLEMSKDWMTDKIYGVFIGVLYKI